MLYVNRNRGETVKVNHDGSNYFYCFCIDEVYEVKRRVNDVSRQSALFSSCGQEVSISINSRAINQVVNKEAGAGNKNKCRQLRWRLSYCQTLPSISDVTVFRL
jgi:hypothetical protein